MAYPQIRNIFAFLSMLRWAEGTDGPQGYRTIFGGTYFNSYKDHPRVVVKYTNKDGKTYHSSAAGAFQFLTKTWDSLVEILDLADFSPESQILGAMQLLEECGTLAALERDDFEQAIYRARNIWASLPDSPYGQPTKKYEDCLAVYKKFGGKSVPTVLL